MDTLEGVPIAGCLGDQQAAMVGQRCAVREAKNTYGTGVRVNEVLPLLPPQPRPLLQMAWLCKYSCARMCFHALLWHGPSIGGCSLACVP